ncbi:MAG: choice-of-anchor D domain-containing protein, partial [Bacteroidetes bacterium]|nr:choice-of-anchor D domain-containing protein [Bacteroidota bacterium]
MKRKTTINFIVSRICLIVGLLLLGLFDNSLLIAQQSNSQLTNVVISTVIPSDSNPCPNDEITVNVEVDMTGMSSPDELLGSFTGSLNWDELVLEYVSHSGILSGFVGNVNDDNAGTGSIVFNGANPSGKGNVFNIVQFTFNVIGSAGSSTTVDLEYAAMSAAGSFTNLIEFLTVNDGFVQVCPEEFPDINVVPGSWDYGDVALGSSSSKTFVVENLGGADLIVTSTTLTGTNASEFSIDNGGAPFTVVPEGNHNVVVSFNPTSEGSKVCTLSIGSNDLDENPKDIPLTGNGTIGTPLDPIAPLEAFPDEIITVNIDVGSASNPVDLSVISFELLFTNTGIIDYLEFTIGDFWVGNTPSVVEIPDDPHGKISISMFLIGGCQSGYGTIISFNFHVLPHAVESQTIDWSFGLVAANDCNSDPISIQLGTATTTIIPGVCVWPGDTDNNGVVQIIDINQIITRFGNTGPSCPPGGCDWNCRICMPWSPISDTYIDANGNGVIDITDINCVVINFGQTHSVTSKPEDKSIDKSNNINADPVLTGTSPSYMDPGEEYWVEITVGESILPVTDMNVISFDLLFDNTEYIDYLGFEVGSFMSGATAIVIPDDPNGKVSASLFNIAQGYTGYGVVIRFNFVVNITTPPAPAILINNTWGVVQANRVDGSEQPLDPQPFTYDIVPVELKSFTASLSGNSITILWTTATELNNKGFEIERMLDKDWEKIAFVEGNGTTTKEQQYQYT